MIDNIETIAQLAGTAKAAYADLTIGDLKSSLTNPNSGAGFTDKEAETFVDRYVFINQQKNTDTGFSAAVFQDKTTGKLILAIRGTEFLSQDLTAADLIDIGMVGFAHRQAVDLYRYWRQLTTPGGQAVNYSNEEIENLTNMYAGDISVGAAHDAAVRNMRNKISGDTGILSNKIPSYMQLDVTGHSLGGNLAYVFSRMFPGNAHEVVTLNAPGIRGNTLLSNLGYNGNASITSINGEGDVIHLLSGIQPGAIVEIAQELGSNHSVINGVDSLNILSLFENLDSSQSISDASGVLKYFMRAASNMSLDVYENMLDGLRKTLSLKSNNQNVFVKTPLATKDDVDNRNIFYKNIDELRISLTQGELKYLVGKVSLVKASVNPKYSQIDYGQFLALYFLTPFALSGYESDLKNLNPDVYALWVADKSLGSEDRNNGKANFSDMWYRDRTAALTALIARNTADSDFDTTTNQTNYVSYRDENVIVTSEPSSWIFKPFEIVRFGYTTNDSISGYINNDRLYGGAGNDTLNGKEGHDYLEGGAGDDLLYGGDGTDQLYGGVGDDQLVGEGGNDLLFGGEGNDTYSFTGQFGRDVIEDSDGVGSIEFNSIQLSQLTQSSKDSIIYYDDINNPTKKAVLINEGNTQSLLISTVTKTGEKLIDSGNSVTIKNWVNGNLGLNLLTAPTKAIDMSDVYTATGNNDKNSLTLFGPWLDALSASADFPYKRLLASGGNGRDFLMGTLQGADTLKGDAGDDLIYGGSDISAKNFTQSAYFQTTPHDGVDEIDGGAGNDYILESARGSIVHGGDGNDIIVGDHIASAHFFETKYIPRSGPSITITREQVWQDYSLFLTPTVGANVTGSTFSYFLSPFDSAKNTNQWTPFASVSGAPAWYIQRLNNANVPNAYTLSIYYGDEPPEIRVLSDGSWVSPTGQNSSFFDITADWRNTVTHNQINELVDMQGVNFYGDAGQDTIYGSYMSDYLSGGKDKDVIWGGYGHDLIDGGTEDDTLWGGAGNDTIIGGDGNDLLQGNGYQVIESWLTNKADKDVLYGGKGNDTLEGDDGDDYLDGGTGTDILMGGKGRDYLYGGDDDEIDYLSGDENDDIIIVGKNDRVAGGSGNDIYFWDISQVTKTPGQPANIPNTNTVNNTVNNTTSLADVGSQYSFSPQADFTYILDNEGSDTLAIAGAQKLSDISVDVIGNSLWITANGNQINIQDGAANAPMQIVTGDSVEQIIETSVSVIPVTDDTFLNGEQTYNNTASLILNNVQNTVTLTATSAGSYLAGGRLKDTLTANSGGTHFIGGKGNDILLGDIGDDDYLIRKGDGLDTITEKGGNNTIKFDKNIAVSELGVRRSGADLILNVSDDQAITVKNMFNAQTGALVATSAIQTVKFYDESSWDINKLKQQAVLGASTDDVINGFETGDTIVGGKGNDQLNGGTGDDIYQYALGDGNDVITDTAGANRIEFTNGILSSQVTLFRDVYNNLIIKFNNGEKITVANAFDSNGNFASRTIESIKFSDNTSWTTSQIQQAITATTHQLLNGTPDDDRLGGDNIKSIFNGGKGNDQLIGGAADDIYQYALGDGNDVIIDSAGVDRIELSAGITQSQTIAQSNGSDLILRFMDGGTLTVKDMFVNKSQVPVDPQIISVVQQLQTKWISQAERLIENNYGLMGKGDITLNLGRGFAGSEAARVDIVYGANSYTALTLNIDLDKFDTPPNGEGPMYYDRVIAHEMVHAIMALNTNAMLLPGWFTEGIAEFIHGADERVRNDMAILTSQTNVNSLFKTTLGSPSSSAGYSVSYIAVKLLDSEIRKNGGQGIKDVFDQLKTGNTLDQSLSLVSARFNNMNGLWNNLSSFENHFKIVGYASINNLLNLNDFDTGSIAGSDYGNLPLDAKNIIPDTNSGPSTRFNLIIPPEYTSSVGIFNQIESIRFSDGDTWDMARIEQEVLKNSNQTINGTPDSDSLFGGNGDDTLTGGYGNDELSGGAGNDIYRYELGDGVDLITDTDGIDRIELGAGITQNQVAVKKDSSNNLILTFVDEGSIKIVNAFDSNGNFNHNAIETVKFSDESVWDLAKLKQLIAPPGKMLIGTTKIDDLIGSIGNDTFIGGRGSDKLSGGAGDDTYIFNRGDGVDKIYDASGFDTIQFGEGISPDEVIVFRNEKNLYFVLSNGEMVEAVGNPNSATYDAAYAIEQVRFSNGDIWNVDTIEQKIAATLANPNIVLGRASWDEIYKIGLVGYYINGLEGDDNIVGGDGNDTIVGGAGLNFLDGSGGSDTYLITEESGYRGSDFLASKDGGNFITSFRDSGDRILFAEGITPEDVTVRIIPGRSESGLDDGVLYKYSIEHEDDYWTLQLQTNIATVYLLDVFNSDRNHYYGASLFNTGLKQTIEFFDGTIWTLNDALNQAVKATENNDAIFGAASSAVVDGLNGNDFISTPGITSHTLIGGLGNDTLSGGAGDDIYYGGSGNDYLIDASGNDIYHFNLGDGTDQITDSYGKDTIFFGAGISVDDVVLTQQDNDMLISVGTSGDKIVVKNWFVNRSDYYSGGRIEYLQFNDGQVLNFDPKSIPLLIEGNDGSNTLEGGFANDTLIGHAGNDYLRGDLGDDEYRFNRGDGVDYITDSGGIDKIVFDSSIAPEDIRVFWTDYRELVLEMDPDNKIIINDLYGFNYSNPDLILMQQNVIETVHFSNGVIWDLQYLLQQANAGAAGNDVIYGSEANNILDGQSGNDTIYAGAGNDSVSGGAGDDYLYGNDGDDTLIGGTGADHLYGGYGNDVYLIDVLDGNDVIYDESGNDSIEFGASIKPENITVTRTEGDLILKIKNGGSITISNFFQGEQSLRGIDVGAIENIIFADTMRWNIQDIVSKISILGTSGANTIYGYDSNDLIDGKEGNDKLYGGGGNDTIIGGSGNDTIFGESGDNLLLGGDGDDMFAPASGNNIYIGGKGNDYISLSNSYDEKYLESAIVRFDLGDGIDTIYGAKNNLTRLELGAGISPDMLYIKSYAIDKSLGSWSSDLENRFDLGVKGASDLIAGLYTDGSFEIKFADNSIWDQQKIISEVNKTKVFLSNNRSELTGTTDEGAELIISYRNKDNSVTTYPGILVDSSGKYSFNFGFPIADPTRITVIRKDSASINLPITVVAPIVDDNVPNSPSAEFDPTGFIVKGTARPDTIVSVAINDVYAEWTRADSISGAYLIKLRAAPVNGEQIKITASTGLISSAPTLLIAPDYTAPLDTSAGFNFSGTVLSGTAEKNSYLLVLDLENHVLATGMSDSLTGAYAIEFAQAVNDGRLVNVIVKDEAGNSSKPFLVRSPDLAAPKNFYGSLDDTGRVISGFAEPSATVEVRDVDNKLLRSATASIDGAFNITLGSALAINQMVNIRLVDAKGNASLFPLGMANSSIPRPTGAFSADGKSISGSGPIGSQIVIRDNDNVEIGRTSTAADGSYSFVLPKQIINHEIFSVSALTSANKSSPAFYVMAPDKTAPFTPLASLNQYGYEVTGYVEIGSSVVIKDASNTVIGTPTPNAQTGYFYQSINTLKNGEHIFVYSMDRSGNISLPKELIGPDQTPPSELTASFNESGTEILGKAELGALIYVAFSAPNSSNVRVLANTVASSIDGSFSLALPDSIIDGSSVDLFVSDMSGNLSSISVQSPDLTRPLPVVAVFDSVGKVISGNVQIGETGGTVTVRDSTNTTVLGSTVIKPYDLTFKITLPIALINNEAVNVVLTDLAGNSSYVTTLHAPDKTKPILSSAAFDTTYSFVTGNTEAGSTVIVKKGTTELARATADNNGDYKVVLPSALINKEVIIVSAIDAAGNASTTNKTLTAPDKTPPVQPTAAIDSTGKIVSGDAEAGSSVEITNAAGTSLVKVTANSSGKYTATLPVALLNFEVLHITATDTAKNASDVRTINAPDKTKPIPPTAAIDNTSKIVSGVAEPGSTVEVKNSTNITSLGTATAHATTGAYSITLPNALTNSETVNVTATDAAGNVSTPFSITLSVSGTPNTSALTIQAEDFTSMLGISTQTTSDAGGGQNVGNIEKGDWMVYGNATLTALTQGTYKVTYRVASANGGGKISLREASNDSVLGVISIPKTGAWQGWVDVTQEITLSSGAHSFKLYAEAGGFNINWFKVEPVGAVVISDTTPPVQPTAVFDNTGKIISGVAEAGSTVEVKDNTNTILQSVTANATTGAYSITLPTAFINKEIMNVTAKDAAGNISPAISVIAPDKTPPVQPTAVFDSTGKIISGIAEAGSTVQVKNSTNTTSLGTVTAHVTTGAYSITLPVALINSETVNVTATDAAGNVSTPFSVASPVLSTPLPSALIIQAEDFTSMSGVSTQTTSDVGGGRNAGDIEKGDWMVYGNATLTAPAQGTYKVTYRVASRNGGGKISLREASSDSTLAVVSIPKTDAWQNWVDVTQEITLSSGTHSFKLYAEAGGFNINWFKVEPVGAVVIPDITPPAQPSAAFDSTGIIVSGTAEAGSTVEVRNSINTILLGSVVAHATTGVYSITLPTAFINKEIVSVTAKDAAGNTSVVKSITAPDKTAPSQPTATFDTAGKVISGVAEAGSTVEVKNSTNTTSLGIVTVHVTTGAYSITLPTALVNSETVNVTATDAAGNVSTPFSATSPVSSTPLPSALIIQAEDFTSMSGVSTQTTSDVGGGRNAGDIEKGDWMVYGNATLAVPIQGTYKVTYRVASRNGGGKISLREASNDSTLAVMSIPKTDAWQNWVDVTQEITLSSGTHSFKLYAEAGGFNINWFKVEPVPLVVNSSMMKSSGSSMSSWNQFDGMIQAMATFSPPSATESKVLVGIYDSTQPILASNP
jgi:Ca2+-binding RTX toxin-like protein